MSASALAALDILGLLQATDRHGALVARLDVTQWPVTVGRALSADLVLDDSHVAAQHLHLDRTPEGDVTVLVLDTLNGVQLLGTQHARGSTFNWPAGQALILGRLKLSLRLADAPLVEEPLPLFSWRKVAWTVAAVAALLVVVLAQAWLTLIEPAQLARGLPGLLAASVVAVMVWAGLWALATKLFTPRLQFWRHVRIASIASVAVQALVALAGLLAFMFSLESLARFEPQLNLLAVAVAVYMHLTVIVPQRRRGMAALMAGLAVLGLVAMLGTTYLQTKRFSSRLYMTNLYPPSWRMARAVPVEQFLYKALGDAGAIRKRLDERLKAQDEEGDSGGGEGVTDETGE